MRRKYFTSLIKLSIILLNCNFISKAVAKEKEGDTNIICFAAKDKWICAPKDQQNLANEKAEKLLKIQSSDIGSSEIVIKPINIPKFNANNLFDSVNATQPVSNEKNQIKEVSENSQNLTESEVRFKDTDTSTENPYANLWSHQLIGVSSAQNAINYVVQKKLNKEDVLILKSSRSNQDWWIVLFGLYKDKQTGIDNAVNLPMNIDPPWLRPLKNLEVKGFIESY